MEKSIELTPIQIKAKEEGTTMFIVSIDTRLKAYYILINPNSTLYKDVLKRKIIQYYSPVQIGDKDIFVKEEFLTYSNKSCLTYNPKLKLLEGIKYRRDALDDRYDEGDYPFNLDYYWQSASQMKKSQSRYSFEECIDVKIVRVQDIGKDIILIKKLGITEDDAILCNGWNPSYIDPDSGGILDWENAFISFYNQQMKEQGINRTYEDNDYIFLLEFK